MLEEKYGYIINGYESPKGVGTPDFKGAKEWCFKLLEPLTEINPMIVLDYGCADGRLVNFMSAVYKDWKYFGLEHPDSACQVFAKKSPFFKDSRCTYGLMGTDIEKQALEECNGIVLGSVFTHLSFDDFKSTMKKFKPVLDRNGEVSFSVFIGEEEAVTEHKGVYNVDNCYALSFYTEKQLYNWAKYHKIELTEHENFLAQRVHLHRIFKARRK